ncbi:MAG: pro-sigmaK processing inhibitor BofA family protein [Eubacterium sp.]|nr:pro-sigmaK processing inhibitor BofA family protein [Eubacterium sp.]MDD7210291.1 pro-sigmaK processing inhibitor BofA family protein [Lachnospiraceae bacterium]MDY5498409.1 pro-sigmaK processing inhibitor BofA family protein [Anaerobutyricum sp.]
MSQNQILLIFLLACLAGYAIYAIKKRPATLLFFMGRSAAGLSFIYFMNFILNAREIVTGIGINPLTGLISAILGIPGAILLYAIHLYTLM